MEDALVHDDGNYTLGETKFIVLILVLMEDALVLSIISWVLWTKVVLILVLMEDALVLITLTSLSQASELS